MSGESYLEPYRQSQRQHGTDFEVTLWASRRSQRVRFDVMAHMAYLGGKRILDAGCSRGDFAAYLLERGIQYGQYVGVDALGEVIEFARARNLSNAEFIKGDFMQDPPLLSSGAPQVVCISGSLNTMSDAEVMAVLEQAWVAAGEVLLFNFLPTTAGPQAPSQTGPARRLNTLWLLDWVQSRTPVWAFRQDYFAHGHDATVMMRKEKHHEVQE
ncbi:MAG: class I SAM-dependent methyltransferase [Phycisphaeraceae bacterium]|nr:class I SAM-dependent methyltransferase [Phycisphaeraceae bacterium]